MVARLQRLIVYALLTVSIVCLTIGLTTDHLLIGVAAALLTLSGYSLVLAAELVCLSLVEPTANRPSIGDLVRAWWGESVVAPQVFFWRQPFRVKAEADDLRPSAAGARGVLLVHGLVCNRGFWNPWAHKLRQRGIPFLAIDLEPIFTSIDSYALTIDAAVRQITSATGNAPVIVAHSMGGLAVRHWLATYGRNADVHRVITIGTPHRGTWLARLGHGQSAREMVIGSKWLATLDAATASARHASMFTCFYGECDNVVFPTRCACLDGADNRRLRRTAHVALAFHEAVFAEALRSVAAPVCVQSSRSPGSISPASTSGSDAARW